MTRTIDADALREQWLSVIGNDFKASDFVRTIDEQPTIDAVPVRHGKWIKGANLGLGVYTLACDKCGYCDVSSRVINFCPNCGCRMEEE